MTEEENINEEEKIKIQKGILFKQLDELEKQRLELKVEDGTAYHCKKCGFVIQNSDFNEEATKYQLCWVCLEIYRNTEKRQMLLEKFKDATLTDLSLGCTQITEMTLETDSKKFIFKLDCWEDDHHMVFDEFDKEEVKK